MHWINSYTECAQYLLSIQAILLGLKVRASAGKPSD